MWHRVARSEKFLALTSDLDETPLMLGVHMTVLVFEQTNSDQNRHRRYDDTPGDEWEIQCCHIDKRIRVNNSILCYVFTKCKSASVSLKRQKAVKSLLKPVAISLKISDSHINGIVTACKCVPHTEPGEISYFRLEILG